MELNRDEAIRAKEMAEKKFLSKDYNGAKIFALKAQSLFPELEGISQMVSTFEVYVSAENKINNESDWYGILSVSPQADDQTLRKQYRKMALILHPDKNKSVGAEGAFKYMSEAWRFLSDKEKRQNYDYRRQQRSYAKDSEPASSQKPPARDYYHFPNNTSDNVSASWQNPSASDYFHFPNNTFVDVPTSSQNPSASDYFHFPNNIFVDVPTSPQNPSASDYFHFPNNTFVDVSTSSQNPSAVHSYHFPDIASANIYMLRQKHNVTSVNVPGSWQKSSASDYYNSPNNTSANVHVLSHKGTASDYYHFPNNASVMKTNHENIWTQQPPMVPSHNPFPSPLADTTLSPEPSTHAGSSYAPREPGNTFWTVCHGCRMQYEYLRVYHNCNLLCPNCREPFLAIETAPPPKKATRWNFNLEEMKSRFAACKRAASLGKYSVDGSSYSYQWSPFYHTGTPSQAADMVQPEDAGLKRPSDDSSSSQASKRRS